MKKSKKKFEKKKIFLLQLVVIVFLSVATIFISNQTLQQQNLKGRAQTLVNCDVPASELVMTASEVKFLGLLNAYRAQNGAPPMAVSPQLKRSAEWQSNHMATGGPFSHTDSFGRSPATRMKNCGFTGNASAENIAYNQSADSAAKTFDQWKNSAGHNKIMLTATYTQVGIAEKVAPNGKNRYWTLNASTGKPSGTVPTAPPAAPTTAPQPTTPQQQPTNGPGPSTAPSSQPQPTPQDPTPTFTCLGACVTNMPTPHEPTTEPDEPDKPTDPPDNGPVPTTPGGNNNNNGGGSGGQPQLPADQGLIVLLLILIIQIIRGLFGGF